MRNEEVFEPMIEDGLVLNGCLPMTGKSSALLEATKKKSVSIQDAVWADNGQPPIIKWDAAFEKWLNQRVKEADLYREAGICTFPWQVLKSLPKYRKSSEILAWNQGSIPSCSLHGATHGAQCTILSEMVRGASTIYDAFNPIIPFYIARGYNLSGGLDLVTTAKSVNEGGMYSVTDVGDDNTKVPTNWERFKANAKRHQVALCFIEGNLVENILKCARADLYVTFGSNTIFTGSVNKGGVKILSGRSYGGHAQCFGCWRKVGKAQFVFDFNSHGNRYGVSDEGELASGAWTTEDQLEEFVSSMTRYGDPYVNVSVEAVRTKEISFKNDFKVPFPKKFKK